MHAVCPKCQHIHGEGSSHTRLRGMFQSCRTPVRRIGRALGREGKFVLLSISRFFGEIVFNQSTEREVEVVRVEEKADGLLARNYLEGG